MAASHPIDLSAGKLLHDIPFFIRVYENGKVERLSGTDVVPPGVDPSTGVQSKDVVICPETNVGVRIYIPKTTAAAAVKQKLPVLIYFHGGGFVIESPYSSQYNSFHNLLVPEANVVAVSVDYRLAPQPPFPTQYDDCWEAIHWVASHADRAGPEPWLNDYADLENVVFAGDSAGGNIAHQMAMRVGLGPVQGIGLRGIVMLHPFFWGEERIGQEEAHPYLGSVSALWDLLYPDRKDLDDPYINPCTDPNLGKLGAPKVLIFVAGQDVLWKRGEYYRQGLCESGWKGEIEVMEAVEEGHVYFLFFPESENTVKLRARLCKFIEECKSKS